MMMYNGLPEQVQTEASALLSDIRQAAQRFFQSAPGSHDWEHTRRVHRLCRHIGPRENADMTVLEAAAYLHDIGRPDQERSGGTVCHAATGAQMARSIVEALPIQDDRRANIIHCVRSHRFRDGHSPATIEAKCLFDADKLDAIGAIGIARAYQFAGELGACLHNPDILPRESIPYSRNDTGYREYVVKLSRIKDRMITREGQRMAEARHAFMVAFFDRFLKEVEGFC
jgi:uncharacterized protein